MQLHKWRHSCQPCLPGRQALQRIHSSQKNSSRCKRGEALSFLLYLFTERSCLWHVRLAPVFIPWSCFFLLVLWVEVSFSDVEGERWVFSMVHRKVSPPPVERVRLSAFGKQDRSQKQSLGQQLWCLPLQRCLTGVRKDGKGCGGSMQQIVECRSLVLNSGQWCPNLPFMLTSVPLGRSFKRRMLSGQN